MNNDDIDWSGFDINNYYDYYKKVVVMLRKSVFMHFQKHLD